MDYIRFYFKDEEDDETFMDSDEDYNIFLDSDCSKVIEGREHKYYKNQKNQKAFLFNINSIILKIIKIIY